MEHTFDFTNPEKKPLGELTFSVKENGVQLKVPALNERWVQPRYYTKYKRLPLGNDGKLCCDAASTDEWINEAEWLNKDLKYLLSLEHFRFWSHIIYEKQCMEMIISFLQEAIPYYIPLRSLQDNPNIIILYSEILQNVLRVICRIITNKESDEAWISKEHLAELIYTKFLISIPMIFDMIIAYGRTNLTILSKIIQTIFKIQPKYNEDLKISIKFLNNTLTVISRKTEGIDDNEGSFNSKNISYDDIALYTLDCASTLSILLEIYPKAKDICHECNLEISITKFYDNTIPLLYKNIYTINDSSKSLKYLNLARAEFLKAFRAIVYLHIETILKEPEQCLLSAENFIATLTECLADRTFVIDYQMHYPVENDIEILKQACKDLDLFKADFVLKAYTSEGESYLMEMMEKNNIDVNPTISSECNGATALPSSSIQNNYDNIVENEAAGGISRDIDSEVTYVLDMLPHLGDGFIRKLLLRYDNPEQAVSAFLEGNIPPDLAEADQNEIYIPDDPRDKFLLETGIERSNTFNGDKYDVLTQDNPECIIKVKKGFPGQPKNVNQLLNDKSFVKEMKEHYKQYSLVEEEEDVNDKEYDDEYDDSYDALAESESKAVIKSKEFKHVIAAINDDEDSGDTEEEEQNDYIGNGDANFNDFERDKTKDFCENPEIIRARYEARRNAKYGNRNPTAQQKSTNVIGNTKGQGQDKETLHNRRRKEENKSLRANHNRKSGATWKRSRGMIPS